jgi:single-stranded DNA-binding protein
MSYRLDTAAAKQADTVFSSIREAGKYVGTITRAEALTSQTGTKGLGLSIRTADGQSADYLDIYTHKSNGEALSGAKTVSAILACLKLREISEGDIKAEKWSKQAGKREQVVVPGYPDLMGKRLGFLLQQELGTNSRNGEDTERMTVFAVFSAETELTASEILEGKANPERLSKLVDALTARPVRDNREKTGRRPAASNGGAAPAGFDPADDDIPF